ncbi:MAG: hypothetical protein OQL09_05650 [Gammaproteobacteria bacterium]|nr:hypothetical protein [Gammaproteobacteria bacterium]
MKTLITLLFLLPGQLMAQYSFEELFDVNPGNKEAIADLVTHHHIEDTDSSFNLQKQQLLSINEQLRKLLQHQPDNPLLWFLQGLNYNNLASLYFTSTPDTSQKYIQQKQHAYDQAIEFDEATQTQLSAAIYATMKHALPGDKKIMAIQKELALGGNGENESYYWYLHWSNIHNLTQAGRLQEARLASKQLQRELLASGYSHSDYQNILVRAKSEIDQAEKYQQITPEKPVKKAAKQGLASQKKQQKLFSMNTILWLAVICLLLLLILGLIYEKNKRSHKK